MEVALPFMAHLAFLMIALGSFALGFVLLTRRTGAQQFLAAPALLALGVWFLHRVIVTI